MDKGYYSGSVSLGRLIYIIAILYFHFSLLSCRKKSVEIPADVLKQQEMIAVLVDVQIAEAALTQRAVTGTSLQSYTASYYKDVFEKHKITPQKYIRSMGWYTRHPELMNKIYEEVINRLSAKQSEVTNN